MSRTTVMPGASAPARARASTAAGTAPASSPIERALRSAAARLASLLWIVGADGAAPMPSAVATAGGRARRRARRRRAARLPGLPVETRLPATARRALRPYGLKRAARRRARTTLLRALAQHQDSLYRHSAGVAALARAVGGRLGLETAELHDVGKLALPNEILEKAGALDDEEWKLMHQHTVVGERMVGALPAVADVGPLVRASHERWDGRGYPDGLAGEEIPLASRIVFACDAFDAMTSARPYQRRPKTPTEALGELEQCAGTQFDHRVVRALVDQVGSSGGPGREEGAMVAG